MAVGPALRPQQRRLIHLARTRRDAGSGPARSEPGLWDDQDGALRDLMTMMSGSEPPSAHDSEVAGSHPALVATKHHTRERSPIGGPALIVRRQEQVRGSR